MDKQISVQDPTDSNYLFEKVSVPNCFGLKQSSFVLGDLKRHVAVR